MKILVCGAINWDTLILVDEFPKGGVEVKANNIISLPGGKGGNTATAAIRILREKKSVGILGVLGYDDIANKQLEIFEKEGIDTSFIVRKNIPSGQAYVIIDKLGENMILTYKAANDMLKPDDITDNINIDMLIVIDPPLESAKRLINLAYNKGKQVLFMPALLTRHSINILEELLRSSDYIILNEHEAMQLTNDQDSIRASKSLSKRFKKVITTLGEKGCILSYNENSVLVPSIDLNMLKLKSISTVGAGDTFAGSFASYLILGFDELKAISLANLTAALKTTRYGARDTPKYEDLEPYINYSLDHIFKNIKFI
jgi:ribokinase